MLASRHRMTGAPQFAATIRHGRRCGSSTLVTHVRTPDGTVTDPLVGFVVSKAVGTAVRRNRVKRRLRHLVAARLRQLPAGSSLVVRALPPAADADAARLGADLDRCLARCLRATSPATAGGAR